MTILHFTDSVGLEPKSYLISLANALLSVKLVIVTPHDNGKSKLHMQKFQGIHNSNSIASVIARASKHSHFSPAFKPLQGLPVELSHEFGIHF